jgi:hypothetical protein
MRPTLAGLHASADRSSRITPPVLRTWASLQAHPSLEEAQAGRLALIPVILRAAEGTYSF